MPVVPFAPVAPAAPKLPDVAPEFMAMAAAGMEQAGRLYISDVDSMQRPPNAAEQRHEEGGGVILYEGEANKFAEALDYYGNINIPKQFLSDDKLGNIVERYKNFFTSKDVNHKFHSDGSLSIWLNNTPDDLVM